MVDTNFKVSSRMIQLSNALIRFRNLELEGIGLTSSQFEVIRYLMLTQNDICTAKRLMKELKLSQSTVAGILKRLQAKGYISRFTDQMDARKEIILLTDAGKELEHSLWEMLECTEETLLQDMDESEKETLCSLIEKALSNIERSCLHTEVTNER